MSNSVPRRLVALVVDDVGGGEYEFSASMDAMLPAERQRVRDLVMRMANRAGLDARFEVIERAPDGWGIPSDRAATPPAEDMAERVEGPKFNAHDDVRPAGTFVRKSSKLSGDVIFLHPGHGVLRDDALLNATTGEQFDVRDVREKAIRVQRFPKTYGDMPIEKGDCIVIVGRP